MTIADSLTRRRSLPPAANWHDWRASDGWTIRAVDWQPRAGETRGSILFVGGRADFIEKYCESYWTWLDWGLGVAAFDWRGQGCSGRLSDHHHKGHCDSFEPWVADLAGLVDWFKAMLPGPHYLVAHSMGGHLTLRHLADRPESVARAVLLAPMLGINSGPLPPALVRRIAAWGARSGRAHRYAPLQGPYRPMLRGTRRQTMLTGDIERFADEGWWIDGDDRLALGGVTYGWLASALHSIDALFASGVLERIATPILSLMGEQERLVDRCAAERAMARLPNARYERIARGAHELLRERDEIRNEVQARIRQFLREEAD